MAFLAFFVVQIIQIPRVFNAVFLEAYYTYKPIFHCYNGLARRWRLLSLSTRQPIHIAMLYDTVLSPVLTVCLFRHKGISAYPISKQQKAKFQPCERTVLMKKKYEKELPRQMYTYFISAAAEFSAPSFSKFARSIGVTLEALEEYRKHKEFDRAWRDCIEIRRDYLTDCALTRRYDPSFVKFLLTVEFGMGEEEKGATDGTLNLRLEVVE